MSGFGGKNPFFDPDDDVDDDTFVNYRSPNYNNPEAQLYEEKRQKLLEERRQVENRMLQSSKAAFSALLEAEQAGIGTAEELVRQGEQLKNVDRNLDTINSITKTTQRHLTAMKSALSSFKTYFKSPKPDGTSLTKPASSPSEEEKAPSHLSNALDQVRTQAEAARVKSHPALCTRGVIDTSGFGAALDANDGDNHDTYRIGSNRKGAPPPQSRSQMIEQQVDSHLDDISSGLDRLKVLAQGLGTELNDQLGLINDISDKAEKADGTIAFQTGQMNRLLKK